jgi:hypothetical protein
VTEGAGPGERHRGHGRVDLDRPHRKPRPDIGLRGELPLGDRNHGGVERREDAPFDVGKLFLHAAKVAREAGREAVDMTQHVTGRPVAERLQRFAQAGRDVAEQPNRVTRLERRRNRRTPSCSRPRSRPRSRGRRAGCTSGRRSRSRLR